MEEIKLTPEQEAEAERIFENAMARAKVELNQAARLVASKKNSELFGETEFQLRDALFRIGSRLVDAALQERKKRGTKVPASSVPAARLTRDL
jgi:hypothetical protein